MVPEGHLSVFSAQPEVLLNYLLNYLFLTRISGFVDSAPNKGPDYGDLVLRYTPKSFACLPVQF